MNIFRDIPPTAGLPLYVKDLFALLLRSCSKGSLEEDFREYLGVPFTQVTYSGTAAFYFILEALKSLSKKKTVVIPAFICPLIPLAIKRAGLNVFACDTNGDNFDFDSRQLERVCTENPDILAIVPTHLGGIPVNLERVWDIARKNKIFVIEDCAQALGATYRKKRVGSQSDFSFFSLCRGKGLTIYEGGVAVAKDERYSSLLEQTIRRLSKNDYLSETIKIIELFGYWIFYRPFLFWFVFHLPQLFWLSKQQPLKAAGEYYTVDFPLHAVSGIRKKLGHLTFPRLEEAIRRQREKTMDYLKLLKGTAGIKMITENEGDLSNYPYLTLLFDQPLKREKATCTFEGMGLGVSQIYLLAITDYAYLKNSIDSYGVSNARALAANHISLSTSPFLKQGDLKCVAESIKKI